MAKLIYELRDDVQTFTGVDESETVH